MRIMLLYVSLLLGLAVKGQRVDISAPSKLSGKTGKFRVIGKNNDGIIIRLYGTEDVIQVYGDDMKLLTSKTIEFKNQSGILQHVMLNKNGAVLFYLQQDKRNSVLLAQPVNSKLVEIGKPIVIDTITDRRDLVEQNLRFKSSADQNQLLIYYPFFAGTTVQSVRFICIDHALNKLYNKTIPFDRNEEELESSKSFVENDGSAYIILRKDWPGYGEQFDVFRVSGTGETGFYSITTDKKLFSEPSFEIDNKNGNLVLCGFYDDEDRKNDASANGFLYLSFNPVNGNPVSSSYTLFPRDFIKELTGKDAAVKSRLYTFNIKKTVLRNDGGALIIAESFIKDTRQSPANTGFQTGFGMGGPAMVTTSIFQFNDIIAFSINAKGETEWSNIMRKKQVSEDDNGSYSSFLIANEKDKLRFIYLDDITSEGLLRQYILNSDGSSMRQDLFNQGDKGLLLLPKSGRQIAPDAVVIPSYYNNTLQLIHITF